MNEIITKRNELLAQKVIKGLESRNMSGYYAKDREEALRIALSLIPEGSSIGMGGAMSALEIGLLQTLKQGNYRFIDRDAAADKRRAMLDAYDADVFISGTNAITEDGVLVNIDGNANRVSAIAHGPCTRTGSCMNCKSPDTICCQFLITRYSRHTGRIHVILVNDTLGF